MFQFLTLKFWFNMRAGTLYPLVQKGLLVFLVMLFLLIFVSLFLKKRKSSYRRIWSKMQSFSTSNLIIGFILLFFTYEGLPFLSMRFWFLLWFLGMLVWLYFIYKETKKIPEIREKRKQEEEFKKYIP